MSTQLSGLAAERVSQAVKAVKDLGARIVETGATGSLTEMARKMRARDDVVVLTCPEAFANYDPESPGRIACILVGKQGYLVVVKNRDYDVERSVRFWYTRGGDVGPFECAVCFKSGGSFLVTRCSHCYGILCKRCDNKTTKDDAHRCPVCRFWRLSGDAFGTPRSLLEDVVVATDGEKQDAVTELVRLLKRLDGHVQILPRVGRSFLLDHAARFTMPSLFELEHLGASLKPLVKNLRRKLAKYNKLAGEDVKIYMFRRTYRIDKEAEKPVLEVSVFRVAYGPGGHTKLLQYPCDAWVNVFEDDEYTCHVKVEYLPPARFPLPEPVLRMFSEVARDAGGREVTVSLTDEAKRSDLNFDADTDAVAETLTPTTAHQSFVEAEIAILLQNNKKPLYAIFRLHVDAEPPTTKISDAIVYMLEGCDAAERLGARRGRAILARDLDGLNCTRTIRDYVEKKR